MQSPDFPCASAALSKAVSRLLRSRVGPAFLAILLTLFSAGSAASQTSRWWKGNLHTHSLWSDGDSFPEMIASWYKTNGYHFLAISDHNVVLAGEKWVVMTNESRRPTLQSYLNTYGSSWVEQRTRSNVVQVRLKTLEEFRPGLEERNRFLLIPSEEITAEYKKLPIHLNASNLRELIKPLSGTNVEDVMQRNVDAVLAQRQRTGQPMIVHLNHPNFGWAITAEELMRVRGERFFEVYNGHPEVHNEGNAERASTERMWDIMLAFRLEKLGLGPMYGLAVDDAHNHHVFSTNRSNPGRGWVVVRAPELTAPALITALEEGDFYASSGVTLKDVRRSARGLTVEIAGEPGVTYTTTFIGTLRGFDPTRRAPAVPEKGNPAVTGLYSQEIGAILGVMSGTSATYEFAGDELYVRATVTSSRPKPNPYRPGEMETAWVQPVILPARGGRP
jgi:hypothetical protein